MTVRVAVDFGTSSTCVAVSIDGREPQVANVDGQPLISSAVFAAGDGTLFVGQEAERQAAIDPARYEPHPKRRIDEGELLLGDRVVPVLDVIRAVLQRAVAEARRFAGGRPLELLVLTHPANWGVIRARTLRQAGAGLANRVVLVPEPVAAAVFHAANHAIPSGNALAVLDLGGGTVDVSVVRRTGDDRGVAGFDVLATKGDPNFGGADIDQILLQHIGSLIEPEYRDQWQQLVTGRELADRRRRRVLRSDVRSAKETLSRHAYTDVPLPPPFSDAHVTRGDLERLIGEPLGRTVALAAATVADSRVPRQRLAGVFLVGGSSRIPQVARLVHERLGIIPVTLDQPETVVARGALRAVTVDPEHTGGFNTAATGQRPVQQRPPVPAAGVPRQNQQAARQGFAPAQPQTPMRPQTPAQAQTPAWLNTAAETPAAKKRDTKKWWLIGIPVAVVVVLGIVLLTVVTPSEKEQQAAPQPQQISIYDFDFQVPADWRQTGGDQNTRKTVISPNVNAAPDNSITVQEFRLNAPAGPDFASELKSALDKQGGFSKFDPQANYAGRNVIYYQGKLASGGPGAVEWYVLVQGNVQVSIGCGYTPDWQDKLRAPCATVVRSMQIRNT